jgi:uncharacterized protein GlcG (DUF336 family)
VADACEAKVAEEGWKMNITVVDSGADLVLFQRMDGASGSVEIAQMKARSSALFSLAYARPRRDRLRQGRRVGAHASPGLRTGSGGLPGRPAGHDRRWRASGRDRSERRHR